MLLLQPSRELLQLGVRLVQPHSWFQASDELVRGSGALIERKRVDSHLQRDPKLRGERRVERGREHADDGVGGTVELDRAADRRRVAREQPLCRQPGGGERPGLVAVEGVIEEGRPERIEAFAQGQAEDEALEVRYWKRAQEDCVERAEDRRVRADAERQGDHHHRCEPWPRAEGSQPVPHVLPEIVHPPPPTMRESSAVPSRIGGGSPVLAGLRLSCPPEVGACGISDPGSGRAVRRLEVRSGKWPWSGFEVCALGLDTPQLESRRRQRVVHGGAAGDPP